MKRTRRNRAFSLVEVVLSLGIVSFSMIGLFGLLLSGLNMFHSSVDRTVEAQIAQQMVNQAELSSYANLAAYTTNFDEYGQGVAAGDPTAVYRANLILTNLPPSLSIVPATTGTNLIVQLSSITSPGTTNIYSAVLVNNN